MHPCSVCVYLHKVAWIVAQRGIRGSLHMARVGKFERIQNLRGKMTVGWNPWRKSLTAYFPRTRASGLRLCVWLHARLLCRRCAPLLFRGSVSARVSHRSLLRRMRCVISSADSGPTVISPLKFPPPQTLSNPQLPPSPKPLGFPLFPRPRASTASCGTTSTSRGSSSSRFLPPTIQPPPKGSYRPSRSCHGGGGSCAPIFPSLFRGSFSPLGSFSPSKGFHTHEQRSAVAVS